MATNEIPVALGGFDTHAGLLRVPAEEQQLFKVMSVENLLRSIEGSYLHFNRVDSYPDALRQRIDGADQLRGGRRDLSPPVRLQRMSSAGSPRPT